MVLVRLAYVADLPSPADLVRSLEGGRAAAASPSPPARAPSPAASLPRAGAAEPARAIAAPEPVIAPAASRPDPQSFLEVVELFDQHREAVLRSHLFANAHLVHFEPGRIELRPNEAAPRDLSNRLGQLLSHWTNRRWVVSVSAEPGQPTLREQADAHASELKSEAARHPLVRAVLDAFPGARIEAVRELSDDDQPPAAADSGDEASEGDEV